MLHVAMDATTWEKERTRTALVRKIAGWGAYRDYEKIVTQLFCTSKLEEKSPLNNLIKLPNTFNSLSITLHCKLLKYTMNKTRLSTFVSLEIGW